MQIIKLPGLIDPHVHLRDPGQTQKEDFTTGTMAALAGGYTTIIDMPNNSTPVFSADVLDEKINIAKDKIVCDTGFYFGTTGENFDEFKKVESNVFGLKVYLNRTTGNFITDTKYLEKIFSSWTQQSPVLLHAIDETIDAVIDALQKTPRPIHICHVSSKYELSKIMEAKAQNLPITCGVTPHHLFLTESDVKNLRAYGMMQPPLRTQNDVDFIWKNIKYVDVIESDHAPHTREEKQSGKAGGASGGLPKSSSSFTDPHSGTRLEVALWEEQATGPAVPFGVPGLETTLPLLLTEVKKEKITIDEVIRLCHINPKEIFHVPDNNSSVEVDLDEAWEITNENLQTKCKWTPFSGRKVCGKIKKITLRNNIVYENGQFQITLGQGSIITPNL